MDERLEALSNKVRCGEPIGFAEALEVIAYQEALREQREAARANSWLCRVKSWFRARTTGATNG